MATIRRTLILAGALAGRTIVLGTGKLSNLKFQFRNGQCTIEGSESDIEGISRYLGKCYQAYPKDSVELEEAQKRDAEHGKRNIQKDQGNRGSASIQSRVQSSGDEATQVPTDNRLESNDANQREEGNLPSGDGQSDSGLSSGESEDDDIERTTKIMSSLSKLDPDDDAHWTQSGAPRVDVVEQFFGTPGPTRKELELAAPGFDREEAKAKLLQDSNLR